MNTKYLEHFSSFHLLNVYVPKFLSSSDVGRQFSDDPIQNYFGWGLIAGFMDYFIRYSALYFGRKCYSKIAKFNVYASFGNWVSQTCRVRFVTLIDHFASCS